MNLVAVRQNHGRIFDPARRGLTCSAARDGSPRMNARTTSATGLAVTAVVVVLSVIVGWIYGSHSALK